MNDFFDDFFDGTEFNDKNKSIVKEMDVKLAFIMDKIDNDINSDYIFSDYKIYVQVINLLEEIDQLWHTIKNQSENMDNVYFTLIQIEDLININIRHFDNTTYNSDIYGPYPAVGRTFKNGKPYIHSEKLDSPPNLDTDSALSQTLQIKVQKLRKG